MDNLKPTFSNIENFSMIYEDNELFTQFINENLNNQSDANAVLLKFSPTIEEFKIIEKIGSDFQRSLNRNYVQFFWPENTGIRLGVLNYLQQNNYNLGKTLLMQALAQALELKLNNELTFKKVTAANFNLFVDINYQENLKASQEYANHANLYYHYQFKADHVIGLIAYYNKKIVGSVIIISSKHYLEVDNLLTVAEFRKQKIASTLLNEIKKMAIQENKTIILKADAEDYPHKIYQKMGFKVKSSQISIKKNLSDNKEF